MFFTCRSLQSSISYLDTEGKKGCNNKNFIKKLKIVEFIFGNFEAWNIVLCTSCLTLLKIVTALLCLRTQISEVRNTFSQEWMTD